MPAFEAPVPLLATPCAAASDDVVFIVDLDIHQPEATDDADVDDRRKISPASSQRKG